jgi:hypothetical protein
MSSQGGIREFDIGQGRRLADGLGCCFRACHNGFRESWRTEIMAQTSTPHVSPADLAHYLRGAQFPASKQDLKADARKNHAPSQILHFIDELPEDQYRTMAEVMKALGQVE